MSKGLMSVKLIMVPDHGSIFLPKKKKVWKELGDQRWAQMEPIQVNYTLSLLTRENSPSLQNSKEL